MEIKKERVEARMRELIDLIERQEIDEEDARYEITNFVEKIAESKKEQAELMKFVKSNQFAY